MKSDLQVITAFLSPRPPGLGVGLSEPLAGPSTRITLATALDRPSAQTAYKIQPRKEVKIKRMTPFYLE